MVKQSNKYIKGICNVAQVNDEGMITLSSLRNKLVLIKQFIIT